MHWKPLFFASPFALVAACMPADGTCTGPGDDHPCQLANHCVNDNGESFCEAGFEWEDPNDGENYVCVPTAGAGAAGVLNWELPSGGHVYGGFNMVAGDGPVGSAVWATVDVDGDGRPDLVSTATRQDQAGTTRAVAHGYPSESHWLVYKNNGGGFDASPARWPVPAGGDVYGGFAWTSAGPSGAGSNGWALVDLTGDGRPDLVVTSLVKTLGSGTKAVASGYPDDPHWLVFANTGTGFAQQAQKFEVPPLGDPEGGINAIAGGSGVGSGVWSLLDVNADLRPDLVMTGVVSSGSQGTVTQALGYPNESHWTVYLNNGSGFGERE